VEKVDGEGEGEGEGSREAAAGGASEAWGGMGIWIGDGWLIEGAAPRA
jgi:hypothetical protein